MRTIWNGSLSFGLVTIPVGLAPATTPKARASDVSFRTLHRECGTPIKQKRWCPVHDREVPQEELVKGWEVSKGQVVIGEEADLEAIAQHETVPEAPVVDLMEALKRSVAATKERTASGDGTKPAARKKAATKKRAAARK